MGNSAAAETSGQMPLLNRNYILMVFVNICLSIAFYFFQPILASYITSLGISVAIAGIVAGLFSITALVARPFTGLLADRISPKVVLMIALPLEAVFGAGYGLIPSLPWIVTCRVIHAVGFALASTVTLVYGSFFIPKERMGEGIGWLSLGSILGTAIGPSIGLGLADMLGYKISFLIGGIIFFVGAVLVGLTRPPKMPTDQKVKRKIRFSDLISVKLIPLSFLAGLFGITNGILISFIALHAEARGIPHVGLYFTIMAVVLVVLRPFAGKLYDRKGLTIIAVPCFICAFFAMLVVAYTTSFAGIALTAVLMAIGEGTSFGAFQTACVRAVPDEQRGVASSTFYLFMDVFQGGAPMAGGKIAELTSVGTQLTYTPLFAMSSWVMVLGLVIYIIYAGIQKKRGIRL